MECFNKFFAFHVFCVVDHHERTIDLCIKTHAAYVNTLVRSDVFVLVLRSGKRKVIFIKGDFTPCNFYGKPIGGSHRFHHHHGRDLASRMFDHVGGKFRKPSAAVCFNGHAGRKKKSREEEKGEKKRGKNFYRYTERERFCSENTFCFFLHKLFFLPLSAAFYVWHMFFIFAVFGKIASKRTFFKLNIA